MTVECIVFSRATGKFFYAIFVPFFVDCTSFSVKNSWSGTCISTHFVALEGDLLNEDMSVRKVMVFSGWHVKKIKLVQHLS